MTTVNSDLHVRVEPTRNSPHAVEVVGAGFLGLATVVGTLVCWAVLFPMLSLPVAAAVVAEVVWGWPAAAAVVGVSTAGLIFWRWTRPEMFRRWVTGRARTRFLVWWRYRRRWNTHLHACGLTIEHAGIARVPVLQQTTIATAVDVLRVRMLPGQCPADYENRVEHLAHAFGATECRATITGPALVQLVMRRGDTLANPTRIPPVGLDLTGGDQEGTAV
ncbi:hypothetical protein [Nocardia sp. alder85J]|uniref:hypothetical protein n=1 Tax=Nocardia sp. alder85J TaxID=2862949 RepID=UPI001CD23BE0|nr:hypothetical protein [Nocardia sp. alder85J]MCX4095061.1 hypothetical protein [Nocardia sp. alder85J]